MAKRQMLRSLLAKEMCSKLFSNKCPSCVDLNIFSDSFLFEYYEFQGEHIVEFFQK